MEITIGFVLYNPHVDFIERLKLLIDNGFTVYIFDNSPEFTDSDARLKKVYDVNYFTCGVNLGLGVGITTICYNALKDNFKALLFFDQDTFFTKETLDYVADFYQFRKNEFKSFAAIQFSNSVNSLNCNFDKFSFKVSMLLISSGSLFNLNILKKINWHDTTYFVDGVDYKFCLQANIKGFLLGECLHTPGFDHITGQADKPYHVFKRKLHLRAYKKERIRDILNSYFKLLLLSLRHNKYLYTKIFVKSFMIFSFYQILVRILNLFKLNENN